MSYFNRNKWWVIAFFLLVLMNLATLTTLWLAKENRPRQHMEGPGSADFLSTELGFDSLQKKQLLLLRDEQQEKIMAMREKTREAKDAFFDLLKEPAIPDSVLEKAAYASSSNDQQMDLLTFRHFQKIRTLCTPGQKEKFDAIIKRITHSMTPPPPPGAQPGPPHEGDDRRPPPPGDRREPPPPHP